MAELGLFPLPLVVVPTEQVPLHIFEPRYRELIGECIERDEDFGIVLLKPSGDIHQIGTRAHVSEVLERLPDGRLNVLVEGGDRFRVLEVGHERSFAVGMVEELVDADEPFAPDDAVRALELFAGIQATVGSSEPAPEVASGQLDWELIASVDFPVELKQQLLELESPQRRLQRLVELLEQALAAVELEAKIHHRAASNGKVSPS